MSIDNALLIVGPFVLAVNLGLMFLYMRPKRGVLFTLGALLAFAVFMHFVMVFTGTLGSEPELYIPIIYLPVVILLFQGPALQKVFYCMMQHQLTALETFVADMLVGVAIGSDSPYALPMFLALSFVLLGAHVTIVLRYGRRLFERMFVDSRFVDWALYSFGMTFSFFLIVSIRWWEVGAGLYTALMLFIVWSFGVLCFTMINTHEKAAQARYAEALLLQMKSMQEQTDAEKKHRNDMAILRHDMRHEMGVVMELFRTGKGQEAEAVYASWQSSLAGAVPKAICAEPMLNAVFGRFEPRAAEKDIPLYITSNIPAEIPIDTIKLSVVVSNALENALAAAERVSEPGRRAVRLKLIQSGNKIGLEVINPCAEPVEFDKAGLPVARMAGHGIGVRSIAAFARENGYLLNFSYMDGKFTMRLVMGMQP